jgi:hypothetical protein
MNKILNSRQLYSVNFYADAGYSPSKSPQTLTITVSKPPPVNSGGGGSGGGATFIVNPSPAPTLNTSNLSALIKPLITFNSISQDQSTELSQRIADCYANALLLQTPCTSVIVLTDPVNWWPISGAIIGAFLMLVALSVMQQRPRRLVMDTILYSIVTIILTQFLVLVGFNAYFLNYLFASDLPGVMFLSFAVWGVAISFILDRITMFRRIPHERL